MNDMKLIAEAWVRGAMTDKEGRALAQAYLDAIKDAERYRWLRDSAAGQWAHPIVVEQRKAPFDTMQYIGPLFGESLDKAIDAALGPQPSEESK